MEEKKLVSKDKVAKRKKKETNLSQPKCLVGSVQFLALKQHSVYFTIKLCGSTSQIFLVSFSI